MKSLVNCEYFLSSITFSRQYLLLEVVLHNKQKGKQLFYYCIIEESQLIEWY